MKSIFSYFIIVSLLLTFGCRKESNSDSIASCGHTYSSGIVKVKSNLGRYSTVKVFPNGTVAVYSWTDTISLYDSDLNYKGYIYLPLVYNIIPLEDNTFLGLNTVTTTISSDTAYTVDGYGVAGADESCEGNYIYKKWDIYQRVQETTTYIKRYNLKGDILTVHSLDGHTNSAVESGGYLYAASLDRDTLRTELSFNNGIYNDTVVYGGERILHLYKLGMNGGTHLHKKVKGIKEGHFHYSTGDPRTEVVGGSLWTYVEKTFIQFDQNLNTQQFYNPMNACAEDITEFSGNASDLVVSSHIDHLSLPDESVIYTIDGTGIPMKLPSKWRGYSILGSSASSILVGNTNEVYKIDRSGNILWQTSQSNEMQGRSFQASCNGQLFGIATSFNHNYLMKISNDGVVPEIPR